MPALVLSRSSRDMPGLRAMPAVMMTMSESRRLVVAVGADDARVEAFDRRGLPLVERLALRNAFDDVDHDDRARELLLGDALRGRRADVAGADDRDLVDHLLLLRCGESVRRKLVTRMLRNEVRDSAADLRQRAQAADAHLQELRAPPACRRERAAKEWLERQSLREAVCGDRSRGRRRDRCAAGRRR